MFNRGDIIQFRQERAVELEEIITGPYLHLSKAVIKDMRTPVGVGAGGVNTKPQFPADEDRLLVLDIKYYPQQGGSEVQEMAYYLCLNLDAGVQIQLTPYYTELNYKLVA